VDRFNSCLVVLICFAARYSY